MSTFSGGPLANIAARAGQGQNPMYNNTPDPAPWGDPDGGFYGLFSRLAADEQEQPGPMAQGMIGAAQGIAREPIGQQSLGQTLNAGLSGFAGAYGAAKRDKGDPSPLQGLLDRIRGTGAHTAAGAMPSPMAQQGAPMQPPQPGAMGGMLGGPQAAMPGGMNPEMLQLLMQQRGMGIG
jgi:hypothetical protein